MKNSHKIFWLGVFIAVVALGFSLFNNTFGNVTYSNATQAGRSENYRFFATSTNQTVFSTTTSAVSTSITPWTDTNGRIDRGYFVIEGAKSVHLFFGRGGSKGPNTGSTSFSVDVSADGSTWYDYARLQLATTTKATADLFFKSVSSGVIGAATTTDVYTMQDLGWYAVRCQVTETTDGEHSCSARAEF